MFQSFTRQSSLLRNSSVFLSRTQFPTSNISHTPSTMYPNWFHSSTINHNKSMTEQAKDVYESTKDFVKDKAEQAREWVAPESMQQSKEKQKKEHHKMEKAKEQAQRDNPASEKLSDAATAAKHATKETAEKLKQKAAK